jgi:uncharacterized protein (DUF1684 family)
MGEEYVSGIERRRREKEQFFREHPRSPVAPEERADLSLSYYPVDADYRFVVALHEHDDPETVTVETTTGEVREYLQWGEFVVELEGESVAIQAYRGDPDEERLWVPFRDATSGDATYGAGRYIDLEPEDRSGDGRWVLDFNEAYNPTCAYAEDYSCPLPPAENWLDVAIEAGEQTPH